MQTVPIASSPLGRLYLNTDMWKSLQSEASRAQSADSSKAGSEPRAFNWVHQYISIIWTLKNAWGRNGYNQFARVSGVVIVALHLGHVYAHSVNLQNQAAGVRAVESFYVLVVSNANINRQGLENFCRQEAFSSLSKFLQDISHATICVWN